MFWFFSFSFLATTFCTSVGEGGGFEIEFSEMCCWRQRLSSNKSKKLHLCFLCQFHHGLLRLHQPVQHIFFRQRVGHGVSCAVSKQELFYVSALWPLPWLRTLVGWAGHQEQCWAQPGLVGVGIFHTLVLVTLALIWNKLVADLPCWKVKYGKQEVVFIHPEGSLTNLDIATLTTEKWNHFRVQ